MFYWTAIIQPLLVSIVIAHAGFVLGRFVTTKFKTTNQLDAFSIGVSFLIGYGLYAYVALVTSMNAPILHESVWIPIVYIFLFGRGYIKDLYSHLYSILKNFRASFSRTEKIISLFFLFAIVFYGSSLFVPQYRIDSLAYHLPEAVQIAEQGIMSLGGVGNFFGNLPILIETLYAPLYVVSGFTAMNITHFGMFLAGCVALYGFLKSHFGRMSAMVATASLFTMYELLVNATSAYVDAATVSFELLGILMFISLLIRKKRDYLVLSGIVFGFALSTKYLSLYSLALLAVAYIVGHLYQKKSIKSFFVNGFIFAIPLSLVAGFWYIKNVVQVGNPMYPFLFGHNGFDPEVLENLNVAVQQFGSRTFIDFIKMPFTLFTTPLYITVFLAFFIFPFAFFVRKYTVYVRTLMLMTVAYFAVWFFAISHQKRFGMVAIALLLILASIAISPLLEKFKKHIESKYTLPVIGMCCVAILGALYMFRSNYYVQVKAAEFSYVLGMDDDQAFYEKRNMGSIFAFSSYINENLDSEDVLHLYPDPAFFLKKSTFVNPIHFIDDNDIIDVDTFSSYISKNNISYIGAYNAEAKDAYLNDPFFIENPAEQDYLKNVLQFVFEIEKLLDEVASPVYDNNGRVLYKVTE